MTKRIVSNATLVLGALALLGLASQASGSRTAGEPLPATVQFGKNPCVVNGTKISGTIQVANSGGPVDEVEKKVWYKPFAKACGVKIVTSAPPSLPKVRAMVKADRVVWDLTYDYDPADTPLGIKEGLWQPLPKGLFAGLNMVKGSVDRWGTWNGPYSTIIAWKRKSFPNGGPRSAADFFNTTKYPGARCMGRSSLDALEIASLANGRNFRTKKYTINIDAALQKLDTIKDDVKLWWTTGNQPIDALSTGECTITQVWNGRVYKANAAGAGIAFSYGASLLRDTWWHIVKGSPNGLGAVALLRYVSQPRQQAAYANLIGYAGGNADAPKLMKPEVRAALATSPKNVAAQKGRTDITWWVNNRTKADRAFEAWLTG